MPSAIRRMALKSQERTALTSQGRMKKVPRRLNLMIPAAAGEEVDALAEESGRSITELVRLSLSLLKVVIDERKQGHKLIVTTSEGQPLKELVLPGF